MSYPFRDVYGPGVPETARLRHADDIAPDPSADNAADYPIPTLSPERSTPNEVSDKDSRYRVSTARTIVLPYRDKRTAKALREIDALTAQATRCRPEPTVQITSGGITVGPDLAPHTDLDEEF